MAACQFPALIASPRVLLLLQVVAQLMAGAGKAIGAYAAELIQILRFALSDSFYEVNILGCECMETVAQTLRRRLHEVRHRGKT